MNKFLEKIKLFFKSNSEIITPTAVLAVICLVVTLALSSANLLTAARIEALAIKTQNEAMAKLIKADEYPALTATTSQGGISYNTAVADGKTVGLIFVTKANGYGGDISVMTAVDMDGKIIAVEILAADDETPGLGQNVTKPEWYAQFSGLKDDITVIKGGTSNTENNEINAVTGATISSKAVTAAVNEALNYATEITVKGES